MTLNGQWLESIQQEIEKLKKLYGNYFPLGHIEIDEFKYDYLLASFKKFIACQVMPGINQEYYGMIMSLFLIEYAKKYGKEQFWDGLTNDHDIHINQNIRSKIFENVENYLDSNNFFLLRNNHKARLLVETFQYHAIIQQSNIKKILDFCSKLYENDLDEEYVDAIANSIVDRIYNRAVDVIKGEDENDENRYAHNNKYSNLITIPRSFLRAFINNKKLLKIIFLDSIKMISDVNTNIKLVNNNLISQRFGTYLCENINDYLVTSKEYNYSDKEHRRGKKKYSTPYYKYDFTVNQLVLIIPEQKINNDYDEAYFKLTENGADIDEIELSIYETKDEYFDRSNPTTIDIEFYYSNLEYSIYTNDEIHKNGTVYRNCILFDSDWKEIYQHDLKDCDSIYILVEKSTKLRIESGSIVQILSKSNYIIYKADISIKSCVNIDDNFLPVDDKYLECGIDDDHIINNVVVLLGDVKYNIYSKLPEIRYILPIGEKITDYKIEINGLPYEFDDATIITSDNKFNDNELNLLSTEFKICSKILSVGKFCNFKIRKRGDNKPTFESKFIVIDDFYYSFDRDIYNGNEKSVKLTQLNSNIINFGKIDIKMPLTVTGNKVLKKVLIDNIESKLCFYIPIFKSYFSNNDGTNIVDSAIIEKNKLLNDSDKIDFYVIAPFDPGKLLICDDNYQYIKSFEGKRVDNAKYRYSITKRLYEFSKHNKVNLFLENCEKKLLHQIYLKPSICEINHIESSDYLKFYDVIFKVRCLDNIGKISITTSNQYHTDQYHPMSLDNGDMKIRIKKSYAPITLIFYVDGTFDKEEIYKYDITDRNLKDNNIQDKTTLKLTIDIDSDNTVTHTVQPDCHDIKKLINRSIKIKNVFLENKIHPIANVKSVFKVNDNYDKFAISIINNENKIQIEYDKVSNNNYEITIDGDGLYYHQRDNIIILDDDDEKYIVVIDHITTDCSLEYMNELWELLRNGKTFLTSHELLEIRNKYKLENRECH